MAEERDRRPELRRKASELLDALSHEEREALLIKCWMSHDARWYIAAAQAFGIEAANRLNQAAAHAEGKAEAQRIVRALQLPPVATVDDYLLAQETMIGLLGPQLLDYEVARSGDDGFEIRIRRCFAHENVSRAGIGEQYECGIFARVTGWLEALGPKYEMHPPLGKCPKVEGRECVYTFRFKGEDAAASSG
ncbi:MAG: hypothetical protein HYY03_08785 [Chloroflexi bacterium]|nr:hypothetical protein [Chloroflexota bacterium]